MDSVLDKRIVRSPLYPQILVWKSVINHFLKYLGMVFNRGGRLCTCTSVATYCAADQWRPVEDPKLFVPVSLLKLSRMISGASINIWLWDHVIVLLGKP